MNIKNIVYNLKNTLLGDSCLVDIAPDNIFITKGITVKNPVSSSVFLRS